MRCVLGFSCMLVLGAMGCSETSGTGGGGGAAGFDTGSCWRGAAGGAGELQPGLHESYDDEGYPVEDPNEACFYVNEDCTGLAPSEECDVGGDGREPQFMGVDWINGVITMAPDPEAIGAGCAPGALAVTREMVADVPIGERGFTFEWTDTDGATWRLHGDYGTSQAYMTASRRDLDGTVCSAFDIVFENNWIRVGPY